MFSLQLHHKMVVDQLLSGVVSKKRKKSRLKDIYHCNLIAIIAQLSIIGHLEWIFAIEVGEGKESINHKAKMGDQKKISQQ